MKIIAFIILFIIFILFLALKGVLKLANSKNIINLDIRNIAHEWIASMPKANVSQQIDASNELIKATFSMLDAAKLAEYNKLMSITDKSGFNPSNFVQLTFKAALGLQNQQKISLEGFDLRRNFEKEMVLFFSKCVSAVLLNTEMDGYELLNRIALEAKGSHIPWSNI
ncbi:hypothetical protein ACOCI4_18200 [Acinetobacter baumannii]|uniref:hypothetical protein n=1 Tax=Acinetobacter TaxID=469 RepID=UPI0013CB01C2|nr:MULTISPECIES: hypothetical protein [Acinetobacter]NDX38888.1 hypothetical protein [Acinetobacter baumannii]HAV5936706.1 hypothetical protein [Acinetobacter baumannii]